MTDLRLTEIWIYPIKSLGGIPLTSARVMGKGLQYDRRFMLVGPDGVCLTQREHPIMALFKLSLEGDQILIRHDSSYDEENKDRIKDAQNDAEERSGSPG